MTAAAAPLDRRLLKVALSIFAAGIAVAGLAWVIDTPQSPRVAPTEKIRIGYGPADFQAALVRANEGISLGEERIARAPEQWAYQESYARALMGRARLTGSFDDLAMASAALKRGLSDAPLGAGPLLTDAVHNMTIHRMGPVPRDLRLLAGAAVPGDTGDRAEAMAIGGDVAFYSGQYASAFRSYGEAARLNQDPGIAVRLANWYKKMGQPDDALAQIDFALRMVAAPTPQFYANMLLQKGVVELARGNWDVARQAFQRADAAFPGYWLTQAHVAQMDAVTGNLAAAERSYKAIIANGETTGAVPDVMDALAALYRAKGDSKNSRYWASRAGTIWDRRVKQLPEAAYGHALEHELVLGSPAKALDLARRNLAARPYGDSVVMLAWTLLANGQPQQAVAAIDALNRTSWRTAQQYVVLSEAHAMLGQSAASAAARSRALELNPRSFDPSASLIWFGNH